MSAIDRQQDAANANADLPIGDMAPQSVDAPLADQVKGGTTDTTTTGAPTPSLFHELVHARTEKIG